MLEGPQDRGSMLDIVYRTDDSAPALQAAAHAVGHLFPAEHVSAVRAEHVELGQARPLRRPFDQPPNR